MPDRQLVADRHRDAGRTRLEGRNCTRFRIRPSQVDGLARHELRGMTHSSVDVSPHRVEGKHSHRPRADFMPLLVLFLVALSVASVVAWVAWHYPAGVASPTPSVAAAQADRPRGRPSQPAPALHQDQAQPGGGDRARPDHCARDGHRGRRLPRRAGVPRTDELTARRPRRERRSVGCGSRRVRVGARTDVDHAARRDLVGRDARNRRLCRGAPTPTQPLDSRLSLHRAGQGSGCSRTASRSCWIACGPS